MKLLLDTHTLLWTLEDNPRLSHAARQAIAEESNELLISAASAMEITTKHRLGKLPEAGKLAADWNGTLSHLKTTSLPITVQHAAHAGNLPFSHGDPFDRMLIAQAQIEDAMLVSNERLFDSFGVRRLW